MTSRKLIICLLASMVMRNPLLLKMRHISFLMFSYIYIYIYYYYIYYYYISIYIIIIRLPILLNSAQYT